MGKLNLSYNGVYRVEKLGFTLGIGFYDSISRNRKVPLRQGDFLNKENSLKEVNANIKPKNEEDLNDLTRKFFSKELANIYNLEI